MPIYLRDFVFGAVILGIAALLLETAARTTHGGAFHLAAVAVGAAAVLLGAPGLVLFGGVLILSRLPGLVRMALRSAD